MSAAPSPVSEVGCAWPLCGQEGGGLVPFVRESDGTVFVHCPPHDFVVKIAARQKAALLSPPGRAETVT